VWVQQTRHKIESLPVLVQICDPPILHVLPDVFAYRLDTDIHWWHGKFSAHVSSDQPSIAVDFAPVELSPTHCPHADVDVSLKDFHPHYPRQSCPFCLCHPLPYSFGHSSSSFPEEKNDEGRKWKKNLEAQQKSDQILSVTLWPWQGVQ
jgi:hypothetical protein